MDALNFDVYYLKKTMTRMSEKYKTKTIFFTISAKEIISNYLNGGMLKKHCHRLAILTTLTPLRLRIPNPPHKYET